MTDQLKHAINAAKTAQIHDVKAEQAEAISVASSSPGEQHFDMSESSYKTSHTAVRKARRFAMQGLYEWLVTDRRFDTSGKFGWKDNAPHDIAARTRATNAMHTVHIGYYHEMMRDIPEQIESLDALISQHLDREVDKLDTVEHAILLIGAYELQNRLEIPYKVVMDEAMKLNNHFGATDAHKLINAVLDKMAGELRAVEVQADTKANKRTSQKPAAQVVATTTEQVVSTKTNSTEIDSMPTASTKPRISANNASVKRNRPKKVSAGTSTAKAAAENNVKTEQESVVPVAIVENNDMAINTDRIIDKTVINETAKEENPDNPSLTSIVGESVTDSLSEVKNDIENDATENNVKKNDVVENKVLESSEADNSAVDSTKTDNAGTDVIEATDSTASTDKSTD